MAKHINDLGRALTILARAHASIHFIDADLAAFGAPSECYSLAHRKDAQILRRARRHAESVAGAPVREIKRQALVRGGLTVPKFEDFVSRVYERTYPF